MRPRSSEPDTLVYSTDSSWAKRAPRTAEGEPRAGAGGQPADRRRGDQPRPTGAAPRDGTVRIWLERKGRNGKPVSILRGLDLRPDALAALATRLKRACGTGGSAKDGEIIIQGDHRARIAAALEADGVRVKLAGG